MILITGVAGYIGSHLANYFDNKNVKYVGIDNLLYSYKTNISNKKILSFRFIRHKETFLYF